MKKLFSIFVLAFIVSACVGVSYCNNKNIVMYMQDHQYDGQIKSDRFQAKYYRKLIKELGEGKYLVQDFYASGKIFTDPYILIEDQLEYVFNEDNYKQPTPVEGKKILRYESGLKYKELNYLKKNKEGVETYWYENGQKGSETPYKLGNIDGKVLSWSEEGQKTMECQYEYGLEHGYCFIWYSGKQIKAVESYSEHGELIFLKQWDPEGNLIKKIGTPPK